MNVAIGPRANSHKSDKGCTAGDKCLFPQYKVDEQLKSKVKTEPFPKRRESDDKKCCDYCEICITTRLCVTTFRCTLSRKFRHYFKEYDSQNIRHVKRISGEIALDRFKAQSASAKSPHCKSHENIEKTAAICLKHQILKTFTNSKRKRRAFHSRGGLSSCVIKKSRRKKSLPKIQERACMCSADEIWTLLSWRSWGHQEVGRRWWRSTAKCKQEWSEKIYQRIRLICPNYASWKNSRSSFLGETLWKSWVFRRAVKKHISTEMAREINARNPTM